MIWSTLMLFAEDPPAQQPQGPGSLPMLIGIMVLGFFLLLMPMRRQKAQQQQLMAGLKRNDKVITGAGIIGVIVDVREKKDDDINEEEVIIRVDDNSNTRIRVLKSSIVRVFASPAAGGESK